MLKYKRTDCLPLNSLIDTVGPSADGRLKAGARWPTASDSARGP